MVSWSKISGRLELKKSWLPKWTSDETYLRMVEDILEKNGSPGRIRTAGQAINSRLLYR